MVDAQHLDEQEVDREPDGAAPVRVAAEEAARGLRGLVVEARRHAVDRDVERVRLVIARERAQAVVREELRRVEHRREQPAQALLVDDREHPPAGVLRRLHVLDDLERLTPVRREPVDAARELGEAREDLGPERRDGGER